MDNKKLAAMAYDNGLKTFQSTSACKNGHIGNRVVRKVSGSISSTCEECLRLSKKLYAESMKGNIEFKKSSVKRQTEYRARHPERVKICSKGTYSKQNPFKRAVNRFRFKSKSKNLPFNLTENYLSSLMPANMLCPILHIPISFNATTRDNRVTFDRIIPEKGYVVGNIAIISEKANRIKQDCIDPQIFRDIANWLENALIGLD